MSSYPVWGLVASTIGTFAWFFLAEQSRHYQIGVVAIYRRMYVVVGYGLLATALHIGFGIWNGRGDPVVGRAAALLVLLALSAVGAVLAVAKVYYTEDRTNTG